MPPLWKAFGWMLGLVLAYWTLLFLAQGWLMYPGRSRTTGRPLPADAQSVWLESAAGKTEAWYLPPLQRKPGRAPVILFAHGNGEWIDDWPDGFADPRRWGCAVLLVEYPGYGRSGGKPSEASIRAALTAAFDWASRQPELDPQRVIAHGRSLGGGAIGALLTARQPAALVLESTFTSARTFAAGYLAPSFLVRDAFDTETALANYHGPVLVLHGEHDELIPPDQARRLAWVAQTSVHWTPGGHNDCPEPWDVLRQFLEQHQLLPKP